RVYMISLPAASSSGIRRAALPQLRCAPGSSARSRQIRPTGPHRRRTTMDDATTHDLLVTSGDVPVAVRDFGGAGPDLLLLHGDGGNLAHMTTLARSLASGYRVIGVDLRGHGRSGDGPWQWDRVVADLDAVAADLRLGPTAVVGMSLGGMVAALWAASH